MVVTKSSVIKSSFHRSPKLTENCLGLASDALIANAGTNFNKNMCIPNIEL